VVLTLARHLWIAACPLAGIIAATPAFADPVSKTAPLVSEEIKEFAPEGIDIGGFRLMPEFEYIVYADDNVYAAPTNTRSDAVMTFAGGLEAKRQMGDVNLGLSANSAIRRYMSLGAENSESASAAVKLGWEPRQSQRLNLSAGWTRVVEERGDPESLPPTITGPRLGNIWEAQARFAQEGGRITFSADTAWRKYDFLGTLNDRRDFTSYVGSATVGTAIGSRLYGTATAYVTHRDFRLLATPLGGNQDQTTVGGRLGIATRERGLIEGRAQVGLFRLNPADPAQQNRSGLSADIALTIRPQRRTAITINAFSGDVATFRLGGVAREDTNLILSVQQEIRHNLYGSLGLAWRRSEFLGSGDVEKTIGPRGEIEWLANKTFSLSAYASFNHRTSNIVLDEFDRFRAGVSARLRY
jgi:hypothetical protein